MANYVPTNRPAAAAFAVGPAPFGRNSMACPRGAICPTGGRRVPFAGGTGVAAATARY